MIGLWILIAEVTSPASPVPEGAVSYPIPLWLVGIVVSALVAAIGILWRDGINVRKDMGELIDKAQKGEIRALTDNADKAEVMTEKMGGVRSAIEALTKAVDELRKGT